MKIISVEGYKAFHGSMIIRNTYGQVFDYIDDKDWLYKPDTNCWYGAGRSFPAECCEIVDNDIIERDE